MQLLVYLITVNLVIYFMFGVSVVIFVTYVVFANFRLSMTANTLILQVLCLPFKTIFPSLVLSHTEDI